MKKTAWRDARLATKIGVLGAALLLAALASIGATLWISWQLVGGAAAVNEAGRLRMQTWELTHVSAHGKAAQAQQLRDRIDASLALLARGEPDACLLVGSETVADFPPAALTHLRRIPVIALDSANVTTPVPAAVRFTTAVYGVHRPGTAYRMDEVPVPLRVLLPTDYPSDAEVLNELLARAG